MRRSPHVLLVAALVTVLVAVAACSSPAASVAPSLPSTLPSSLPSASLPSAVASAAGAFQIAVNAQAAKGPFLVGPDGKTLYVFSKDTATASNCNASCAQTWPPLTLPAGASIPAVAGASGTFATITRSDGSMQVTYKGQPLYSYAADSKPGDTSGDGVGGVWSLAKV